MFFFVFFTINYPRDSIKFQGFNNDRMDDQMTLFSFSTSNPVKCTFNIDNQDVAIPCPWICDTSRPSVRRRITAPNWESKASLRRDTKRSSSSSPWQTKTKKEQNKCSKRNTHNTEHSKDYSAHDGAETTPRKQYCGGTYWIMLMYVSTFIMSPSRQSFLKPSTSVFGFSRPSPAAWAGKWPVRLRPNLTDDSIICYCLLLLPGAGIAPPVSCHQQTQGCRRLCTRVWWASAGSEPVHWLLPWSSVSCSPTQTQRHTRLHW